MVLYKVEK